MAVKKITVKNQFEAVNMIIDTSAKKLKLTASQKAILVTLIRHMNENHQCFPSLSMISHKTGFNIRTISRALNEYKKLNYVKIEKIYNEHTDNLHNLYTINVGLLENIANQDNVVKFASVN